MEQTVCEHCNGHGYLEVEWWVIYRYQDGHDDYGPYPTREEAERKAGTTGERQGWGIVVSIEPRLKKIPANTPSPVATPPAHGGTVARNPPNRRVSLQQEEVVRSAEEDKEAEEQFVYSSDPIGDLDKPFHRPECACERCEKWRRCNGRPLRIRRTR